MTADETWAELKTHVAGENVSDIKIRSNLLDILKASDGPKILKNGLGQSNAGVNHIWRNFAWAVHPPGSAKSSLNEKDQQEVGNHGVALTLGTSAKDSAYWSFQWLRITSNVKAAPNETAERIVELFKAESCKSVDDMIALFSMMHGWGEYPQNRWADLIEKALKARKWNEFGVELAQVIKVFRGHAQNRTLVKSTTPAPSKGEALKPLTSTESPSGKPTLPPQAVEPPPVPTPAFEPANPSPVPVPAATPQLVSLAVSSPETPGPSLSPADPERESAPPVTVSPTAASVRAANKAEKAAAKLAAEVAAALAASSTPPPEPPRGLDPQLVAFFGDMVAAVRSVAGPQEQVGALAKQVAALATRMDAHDGRVADGQRAGVEAGELRARVQEQLSELNEAQRERDDAVGRARELTQRLATSDARIALAEKRADQNIHAAQQERDAVLRTFRAGLWDAVQADLADVSDASPDEEFASVEEKVIMTRLRNVRDALRREGVGP